MSFYFLFIPFLIILFIISYYFLIISAPKFASFRNLRRPFLILLYSHYQILCLITKFSIYPYLSTYKIYIKIRGEDLVPCRGGGSPIPLISRRGSARFRRGHPILIPGGALRGALPTPHLGLPHTGLIISRRGSGETPAYTRSSPSRGALREALLIVFATSAYHSLPPPPIISRPNADLQPSTTPLAPPIFYLSIFY